MARICHLKSANSESHCVSIAWRFSAPIASPLPNPWMRFYLGYEISNSLPFSSSASLFVSVSPRPSLPFPHSPPLPVWRWACISGFVCGVPSTVVLINATCPFLVRALESALSTRVHPDLWKKKVPPWLPVDVFCWCVGAACSLLFCAISTPVL